MGSTNVVRLSISLPKLQQMSQKLLVSCRHLFEWQCHFGYHASLCYFFIAELDWSTTLPVAKIYHVPPPAEVKCHPQTKSYVRLFPKVSRNKTFHPFISFRALGTKTKIVPTSHYFFAKSARLKFWDDLKKMLTNIEGRKSFILALIG